MKRLNYGKRLLFALALRLYLMCRQALQQLVLLVEKHGALEVSSPQIGARAAMRAADGKQFINATGPALQAGQSLTLDISGLPYHPTWPRWTALAIAAGFVVWGLWAGIAGPARRRV